MFDSAATIIEELGRLVDQLRPGTMDDPAAISVLDELDRIERLATAGKALAAAHIEAGDSWRGSGSRDAIGFVAARTDSPRSRVRDSLAVTDAIESAPVLERAFRKGALTVSQAADIAAAISDHPETEAELVALAAQVSPRELKARCVEICAEGEGAEEQHQRARSERSVSSNVGRDGIWRLSARLPVIDGALVDKALDFFQNEIFNQARKKGEREPFDAYRADALVALIRTAMAGPSDQPGEDQPSDQSSKKRSSIRKKSSAIRHTIVVTVPHTVFQPGGLREGEVCLVPGVGPVPQSVVHDLLEEDPVIRAVVTRGREITAVATLTRTIKRDLRLAVLAAHDFECAAPGCTNNRFVQLDHEIEFSRDGPTSYDNLRPLCTFHHNQRTRENYELQGQPGSYEWVGPDNTVLAREPTSTQGFAFGRGAAFPSHCAADPAT